MLFRKRRSRREEDRVWSTDALKFKGVCDEIREMRNAGRSVLIVAHFKDTLQNVKEVMDSENIQYETASDRWEMSDLDFWDMPEPRTVVFLSDLIVSRSDPGRRMEKRSDRRAKLHIIVVEHYPIQERDSKVASFAETLPEGTTFRFHASLEEPLMQMFGADRTFGLLTKLGWKRTEYMSNSAITEAITSGQSKIKRMAASDEHVDSQREWFYYNCPTLRDRLK